MSSFFRNFRHAVVFLLLILGMILLAALVSLVFFEQKIPSVLLERALAKLSTTNLLVTAESATFRFSHGVTVRNLKVFERHRHWMKSNEPVTPMMSASLVDVELDFRHIPWERESLLRGVTLVDFKYPRLPEGYYVPDSIEYPGKPDFLEVNEPVRMELPVIRPFRVRLERPDILSVRPTYVDVGQVEFTRIGMKAERMHLQWPDADTPMTLDGELELNLETQRVQGEVRGLARQHHIRPMLVALDITNSYQFIDAFTGVEAPVGAICRYNVDLCRNDLHLFLDLHPRGGYNRGVPLVSADGTIDLRVFVRDTFQNADIKVDLSSVKLADGTKMRGMVRYENTNDVAYVDFDVISDTAISNALAIADAMNDGTLDCLSITGRAPHVELKGRLAVDSEHHADANDLRGRLEFATGSLFTVPMTDAQTDFSVKGGVVRFENARARSLHGGSVTGTGEIVAPSGEQENPTFRVDLVCTNVPLRDVVEIFNVGSNAVDNAEKRGMIDASLMLSGPMTSNVVERLNGSGSVRFRDGQLAKLHFFAGLSAFLTQRLPGASRVLDPSGASIDFTRSNFDFTMSNGVFRTENLIIEGRVLSIRATGTYDIPHDNLDFKVTVKLLKWDNGIVKPISWVSETLLDFRITGTLDEPQWSYRKNPLKLLPTFDQLKPLNPLPTLNQLNPLKR